MAVLESSEQVAAFVAERPAAAIMFSSPDCSVCQVLKPKLKALLAEQFPHIGWAEVDCEAAPEAAAQERVFSVPTLVIYFEGREAIRKTRNIAPAALAEELVRPYALLFGE